MKLLFIITILASLLSCTKKEADINFSIRVKDNKNISVPNAEVFNNKLIGKTNKDGKKNYKSSYIKNSRLQIEITKNQMMIISHHILKKFHYQIITNPNLLQLYYIQYQNRRIQRS